MNYSILKNEAKFDEFVNLLPDLQDNEVYYLALFARQKYTEIPIKDSNVLRFTSKKEHLKEKIMRLECPFGGYKLDNVTVPQDALALYIGLNPRNIVKANKTLLVELAQGFADGKNVNPLSTALTAIHKAIDRKTFVDFDYDGIAPEQHLPRIKEIIPEFKILKTKGGFHLIVTLAKTPKTNWFKELAALDGCDVKGSNTLIPVPGCTQGNFVP